MAWRSKSAALPDCCWKWLSCCIAILEVAGLPSQLFTLRRLAALGLLEDLADAVDVVGLPKGLGAYGALPILIWLKVGMAEALLWLK